MKGFLTLCILAMALTAGAASPDRNKKRVALTADDSPTVKQEAVIHDIAITDAAGQLDGRWEILEVRRKSLITATPAYLQLDFAGGRLYGNTGCNIINARLSNTTNNIAVSEIATTHHSCVTAQAEQSVIKALGDARSMRADTDGLTTHLYFISAHGSTVLAMRRTDLAALDGAWQVSKLDSIDIAPNAIRVIIDATEGAFLARSTNIVNGITRFDPEVACSVQFENLHTADERTLLTAPEAQLLLALEETATYSITVNRELHLVDTEGITRVILTPLELEKAE